MNRMIARDWCRRVAVLLLLLGGSVCAGSLSFRELSADQQDYVVCCITNNLKTADLMLMRETDCSAEPVRADVPLRVSYEDLGLVAERCVGVLKGDPKLAGTPPLGLYRPPRLLGLLPKLSFRVGGEAGYFEKDDPRYGRFILLKDDGCSGRWRYYPPYDPFRPCSCGIVRLMFLTPVRTIDLLQAKRTFRSIYDDTPKEERTSRFGLDALFASRVFRMNEGCVFEVAHPEAAREAEGDSRGTDTESLKNQRMRCFVHVRLTHEELSELVYLAYLVVGQRDGYERARSENPHILEEVATFHTALGCRLRAALQPSI